MDYQEALEYLDKTIVFGIKPGLKRIKDLLKELGNPQNFYPVIQITGTNGKTSTARIITAILAAHSLKTGTYTSPHLHSYTERITVNGKPILEEDFASLLTVTLPFIEKVNQIQKEPLTHFEILTVLAFLYFQKEKVDVAVVEVGMGGRWDATSIVSPEVAVITNVALEHTARLGKTLKKIAWEKAHIIKEGSSALGGSLEKTALEVVKERCRLKKASLRILGKDFSYPKTPPKLPLLGKYQRENAALALAAAETFLNKPLKNPRVKEAFSKINFPGRFEIIPKDSFLVVLDGAHNPAAASALTQALKERLSWKRLFLILSVLKEKDVSGILREFLPLATFTILTENSSERVAPVEFLSEAIKKVTFRYLEEPSLPRALTLIFRKARSQDLILITGSLYTVAEAREYLVDGP